MTTEHTKLRTVFLATLLVCSVVAAAGPLAGTGSATQTAGNTAILDDSDGPLWYGQEFAINVSQGSGSAFTADTGENLYLLEITDEGEVNLADELTVNDSQYVRIDTGELVTNDGQKYALNDENELTGGEVNFTLNTQTINTTWEADSIQSGSESDALTVESNRGPGNYNVTIRAEGFDYEQLRALFIHPGTDLTEVTSRKHLPSERPGVDPDASDRLEELRDAGYITLNLSTSTNFTEDEEIIANRSNLEDTETVPEEGEYQFEIAVTDSTAEDTATVSFEGDEAEADFEQPLYTRAAGDIARFTVELDSAEQTWVQLRDTDSAFVDVLYLEDDDDDGTVTFYANTRLMGTDHSQLSGIGAGDADVVYHSNDDTVQSHIHHETIPGGSGTEVSDATFYDAERVNSSNEVTFNQYIQSVNGDTPTDQLSRPLATTTYELVLNRDGRFTIEDGEAAVDRPLGESELDLVQPTLRESDPYVAPAGDADGQRSIAELESNLTSSETATIGDRMILRYNTTGIAGALAAIDYAENGNSIDRGLSEGYGVDTFYELTVDHDGTDWEGEGVNFSLLGDRRLNVPSDRLDLDDGGDEDAYVLIDQQTGEGDPGNLYTVIDTGSEAYENSITDGQEYRASLTYVADGSQFRFSGTGPQGGAGGDVTSPAFPYYRSAFRENVTERATIAFESTAVTFDAVEDETVTLEPAPNGTVSGETNLAPGTELTVGVRLGPPSGTLPDEDPSFLAEQAVMVDADGTFDATLDLSSRTVGESATVRVERDQTTIASSDAEFADIGAVRRPYFETELSAPATAQRNESVNITGTVTNTGETAGTADVRIVVDGTAVVRGLFDLESGESRQITHSVQMGQTDIDVGVESQDTSQTATVTYESDTAVSTQTPTRTPGQTDTATPTTEPAVDGPQSTPPPPDSGGGFPWLFAGIGVFVFLFGAAAVVIWWL